ncbi:MAG: hypothetical protein ACR2FV_06400 [Ornithinimicrobium sp.]|uniref:hypothetical protein n=1 Tax=Ornithinimicrobium sp. TaxID=1977084 RepID=UPI0017D0CA8E|nr:hypothetical protein [Actinomycetota bacterium]
MTVGMNVWCGGWFVWAIATGRHTETDGLLLAVAGLTFVAWGCWRLREALR